MPSYDVSAGEFDERLAEIEKTERVVSVVAVGDGAFKIITETRAQRRATGSKETRS